MRLNLSNIYFLFIILIFSFPKESLSEMCIAASDFGLGGQVYVYANPDEAPGGTIHPQRDPKTGNMVDTKLLRLFPRGQQVSPWIDTQLFTTGAVPNPSKPNPYFTKLKAFVEGEWRPWGMDEDAGDNCTLLDCSKTLSSHAICLDGGKKVDDDPFHVYPCVLKKGVGLYGLVAIENNSSFIDPNDVVNATTLPSNYFRTFHVWPLQPGRKADQWYFELPYTQLCENKDDGRTECIIDTKNGVQYTIKGRLYFNILDKHYQDNSGLYMVNVVAGVFSKKGFIEETITTFEESIMKVTTSIYEHISRDLKFITICRAVLLLYVIFTGITFMLGLAQMGQHELIIRLFKVGLITTLISENSWNFFNTYLFNFFTVGSKEIATMIVRATLYYDGDYNQPVFLMPENATALSVFDIFLKMLVSKPVHVKIVSLLFYDWKFYFIPCIYVCFYFIIIGILRSVFLYILAIMQIALLLVVSPIFIIMILFTLTKGLFDEWLKQLINCALLIIIVVSTIALMMSIILEQLQQLLYYEVCWVSVWNPKIGELELFNLYFWYPDSETQVKAALTAAHYFAFLLVCLLFEVFLDEVPKMADALSSAQRPTTQSVFHAAMSQYQGSLLGQIPGYVRAMNPIGIAAQSVPGVKHVAGFARGGYKGVTEGFDKFMYEPSKPSTNLVPDIKKEDVTGGIQKIKDSFQEGYEKTAAKKEKDE